MNEEVSNKTVSLAVTTAKVTGRFLYRVLKEYQNKQKQKAVQRKQKKIVKQQAKKDPEPKKGKMSVKELVGQGQGVSSMDVGDSGVKDFKKIANKYGVDFAIVKDKTADPPKYVVFFKAKDADAITQVLKEYSAKQLNKKKAQEEPKKEKKQRESILQKLKKLKEKAAKSPRKEKEKKKEQTL